MSDAEFKYDDWLDGFREIGAQFEAENDDLEAIFSGDIGFHAFFVADGDDPTRGSLTAVYQALYDNIESLHVDRDVVKWNQGELTPTAVADEVIGQLEGECGLYLNERFRENIRERVEQRIEKNLNKNGGDG